jgi:hypothetical protein
MSRRTTVGHYARAAAGLSVSLVALAFVAGWVGLGSLLSDSEGDR